MNDGNYEIIGSDGQQYGPYSLDELKEYLSEGRLNLQSEVREAGTAGDWVTLDEILNRQSYLSSDELEAAILANGHRLQVGKALSDGWDLFKRHMGLMMGATIVFFLVLMAVSIVPIVGGLIQLCITGPMTGGLFILMLNLIRNDAARLNNLFEGFERCFGKLLAVSLTQGLIGGLASLPGFIMIVLAGVSSLDTVEQNSDDASLAYLVELFSNPLTWIGILIIVVVGWSTYILLYFAIPLAADKGFGFGQAFGVCFRVSWRNYFPLLGVYALGGLVIMVSMIPLGLGLLLSVPWYFAVLAQSYEQILTPETARTN